MLETSKDFLYMSIGVSILGLAAITMLSIFYMAMIFRQGLKIVKETRARLHKIDEAIKAVKEKFDKGHAYMALISEGVKKVAETIQEQTKKTKKRTHK